MSDPILEALEASALELTDEQLRQQIIFIRKTKAQHDAGVKPKKEGADIDVIEALGIKPKITEGRR